MQLACCPFSESKWAFLFFCAQHRSAAAHAASACLCCSPALLPDGLGTVHPLSEITLHPHLCSCMSLRPGPRGGGAICQCPLTLQSCNFARNIGQSGGAIYATTGCRIAVSDTAFTNNLAKVQILDFMLR